MQERLGIWFLRLGLVEPKMAKASMYNVQGIPPKFHEGSKIDYIDRI